MDKIVMRQVICNGEFNGLKTLIMKENKCAFDVHCFTHQLQLALVTDKESYSNFLSIQSSC